MVYKEKISIPQEEAERLERYLKEQPASEEESMAEEDMVVYTAAFPDGYEIDVRVCGVQYSEGDDNRAWTEAILFRNGSEVCCSDIRDSLTGLWELTDGENMFIVDVVIQPEGKKK